MIRLLTAHRRRRVDIHFGNRTAQVQDELTDFASALENQRLFQDFTSAYSFYTIDHGMEIDEFATTIDLQAAWGREMMNTLLRPGFVARCQPMLMLPGTPDTRFSDDESEREYDHAWRMCVARYPWVRADVVTFNYFYKLFFYRRPTGDFVPTLNPYPPVIVVHPTIERTGDVMLRYGIETEVLREQTLYIRVIEFVRPRNLIGYNNFDDSCPYKEDAKERYETVLDCISGNGVSRFVCERIARNTVDIEARYTCDRLITNWRTYEREDTDRDFALLVVCGIFYTSVFVPSVNMDDRLNLMYSTHELLYAGLTGFSNERVRAVTGIEDLKDKKEDN